ncbi:MAG: serine/threonine protein kinase [Fuerstiella sp.]|nr:serine/threonine protein kinase [Fuerstiella sp.]
MEKRQIGPFILEEQIGIGGMGVVYRATYPKNNKKVAVKILAPGLMEDPKLLSRFEREIKILKRLSHPNIVRYYGGGTENNQRYYAMQFIDGGSLQEMIKQRGRLTWEQTIHVGRQVCSALEHAHNAGIVHRDLKPANLFVSRKGRLMLGDFGIARDTEATALTAAGKTVGTYAYMAPEQINGAHPICGKTDLYALGCLMYEVLVGETPFVSDNPAQMLMQHMNDDPHNVTEFAPDCPVWLDNLVDRMLSKNPDERPFDALAVHTELGEIREKLASGNSVTADATTPAAQIDTRVDRDQLRKSLGKKKKKKKKREDVPLHEQTWFLATCLLALIGVTIWLLWPKSVASIHAELTLEMETGDWTTQRDTLDQWIEIEKDYPNTQFAIDARFWIDHLHLGILERQMKNKVERGLGKIETALEQRCKDIFDFDGNLLSVVEQYDDIVQEFDELTFAHLERDPPPYQLTLDEFRTWRLYLSNRRDEALQKVMESTACRELFSSWMRRTEELYATGGIQQALKTWTVTARLYLNEDRVSDFRRYAERRSRGLMAEIPLVEPL